MTRVTDFAYAQARLQARRARAPDDAWWRSAEASRTLAQYLALARAGPFAAWTEGLAPDAEAPDIEAHLMARWHRHVEQVARWLPPRWRAAVRAYADWPGLPRQEPTPVAADATRALAAWRRLLPGGDDATLVARPALLLLPRAAAPRALRDAAAADERHELTRLFRRHPASAVAVFAELTRAALDLERLRGGAVARALFAPPVDVPGGR